MASRSRGAFLQTFPVNRLPYLTLESYVIGLQSPTFCDYVEVKTRSWAIIQGATAFNYYGRTKSDKTEKYRFTSKFGTTEEEAFAAVSRLCLIWGKNAPRTPRTFQHWMKIHSLRCSKPRFLACIFRNAF